MYSTLKKYYFLGIPKIFDIIYDERTIVFEEYIEGESLSEIGATSLTSDSFKSYMTNLLHILNNIHKHNIIHRDIKEDNIIIDTNNKPILIDFAISKILELNSTDIYLDESSYNENCLGSITYAAPEQFGITPTDQRSDIYSFGIVCKNLLRVCSDLSSSEKKLWEHIISKCTEFSPELRYQSVEDILKIIEQPSFFHGNPNEHIINFKNTNYPPCVQIHSDETKSVTNLMNFDKITISEKYGIVFLQYFFNTYSNNQIIFEKRLTSSPSEQTLTEIFFLEDSLLIARAFFYPLTIQAKYCRIINYYQICQVKFSSESEIILCNIYENLTGYSVLGDSEVLLDNANLATYRL